MTDYRVPPQGNASYAEWMEYAKWAMTYIARLREQIATTIAGTGPGATPKTLNEYCNRADTLIETYWRYGKHAEAGDVFNEILLLAETALDWDPRFSAHLLTCENVGSADAVKRYDEGAKSKLKRLLEVTFQKHPLQTEFDYWRCQSILGTLRVLAKDDAERRSIDRAILRVKVWGAETVFPTNPDLSSAWLAEAAEIAKNRLGEIDFSNELVVEAQAARVKARTAPRLPNAQSIKDDLEEILRRGMMERHRERFIPEASELVAEHTVPVQPGQSPIARLVEDRRLLIDAEKVEERKTRFAKKDLAGVLDAQRVDQNGNVRGWEKPDEGLAFLEQYATEIIDAVGAIFSAWQASQFATQSTLMDFLRSCLGDFDWRLAGSAIERYFEGDYVSAVHILAPQVEALCVYQANKAGFPTSRLDQYNRETTIYLSDLLTTSRAAMQALLGTELYWLVQVFLVESRGGFNIRNKVAHGAIRPEECNSAISAGLLFLTIHIANRPT